MRASIRACLVAGALLPALLLPALAARAPAAAPERAVSRANWSLAAAWRPDSIIARTPSTELEPHWLPDGCFWYRYRTSAGLRYWLVDSARRTREPLFDHDRLAAALSGLAGRPVDARRLDLRDLSIQGGGRLRFTIAGFTLEYEPATDRLVPVAPEPAPPAWADLSPDGALCVFQRGNELWLVETDDPDSTEHRLSEGGRPGYCWGTDWESVANDDPARRWVWVNWSPDSRRFCAFRADVRAVPDLWLVDHLHRPRPALRTYKCPMPGDPVAGWELWIYDHPARRLVKVDADRWPDQDLTDLHAPATTWSAGGDTLTFVRRSRDYTRVDLCAADPATGASRLLIEERLDDAMVYIQAPVLLPERGELLWWSMRDGWGHWYRYGQDGRLLGRVTEGAFNAGTILAVDREAGTLWLLASGREPGRNPYYEHLYRVPLDGGVPRLLTPEDAEHDVAFAPDRGCFVDNVSRVDLPTRSVLRDAGGETLLELETADVSDLVAAGWRPPEVFRALSADGATEQWGVLYKPFDFDSTRRYPVVTRVYPGKQSEFVPTAFNPVDSEASLAQLGLIVVRFGNRGGCPERGLAYREYGRDDFRDYGLADKRAVIEQLAARHAWIDIERVGIYGGSSGGFMTVSALLVHPDFFKVGVAMTSPNDPGGYYNIWVERYAGVREEVGADGARRWVPAPAPGNLELADRLRGRLLMVYGEQDDNVHLLHLMRMADALVKAGKRFDMFIIPGAGHALGDWRYYLGLTRDYFATHLLGDPPRGADMHPAGG
ncbi:MAG: DPP IV N-terminal domain-containing protein [Candidatus Krumholzibacteriota bacterium]|nr:DPP IV N-terminal domain-containing protein [Candidatus Krumholzibacteriota bacterium]